MGIRIDVDLTPGHVPARELEALADFLYDLAHIRSGADDMERKAGYPIVEALKATETEIYADKLVVGETLEADPIPPLVSVVSQQTLSATDLYSAKPQWQTPSADMGDAIAGIGQYVLSPVPSHLAEGVVQFGGPAPTPAPMVSVYPLPTGMQAPQRSAADEPGAQWQTPPTTDSAGLRWDERIHSASKALNADGSWRKRRGVDEATVERVEAELLGVSVEEPQAIVVVPPPPFDPSGHPAAVPAPPIAAITFASLIQRVTAAVSAGTLTILAVSEICQRLGVEALPLVGGRPDLWPAVAAELTAVGV